LGLDSYYRKYLDAGGIPVVAPSDVDDAELYHARDIIFAMLSNRSDLRATMAANHFRVVIFNHDGCRGVYQIPELRDDLPLGRCGGPDGIASYRWSGGNRYAIAVAASRGLPHWIGEFYDFGTKCNVAHVHEFAHLVHFALQSPLSDSQFDARLQSAYGAAMAAGLWKDRYASTNYSEYWAEAVVGWFLPSELTSRTGASVFTLTDYDPGIASLVEEVFGEVVRPDCGWLRVQGKVIGSDGEPMTEILVSVDELATNGQGDFWSLGGITKGDSITGADGVFVLTESRDAWTGYRDALLLETGESDLDIVFRLGVYARKEGADYICHVGYLSRTSGQVENMSWPFADAATFAMPTAPPYELTGITLQIAPNFDWGVPDEC